MRLRISEGGVPQKPPALDAVRLAVHDIVVIAVKATALASARSKLRSR